MDREVVVVRESRDDALCGCEEDGNRRAPRTRSGDNGLYPFVTSVQITCARLYDDIEY